MKLTDTEREIFKKSLDRIKELSKYQGEIYEIARVLSHGIVLGDFMKEKEKEEK